MKKFMKRMSYLWETLSHNKIWLWFDRLLSKSLLRQLLVLAVVLLVALAVSYGLLAFSGSQWKAFCVEKKMSLWTLPVYLLIDSNALNNLYVYSGGPNMHGWMLIASSITFIIGMFIFNGAIIAIITNSIEQRVRKHREGHLHYLKSGHYVIMGYDEMVPSIIEYIFEKEKGNDPYVLLLSASNAESVREKLRRIFSEEELKRVITNFGHRMSKDYYKDIHLESAKGIFVVGLRTLPAHDAVNVECMDSIHSYLTQPDVTRRPEKITCVFEDLDTYAAFKTTEIFSKISALGIEVMPYNFYAGWAKQVFVERRHRDMNRPGNVIDYPTVYGKGWSREAPLALTADDPRYVHLVFVGITNFSVAFAIEAAHVLHFPNFCKNRQLKTLITFIDINADKEKDEFITRNRHLFEVQSYRYTDLSMPVAPQSPLNTVPLDEERNELLRFHDDDANFLDVQFQFIKGDVFSSRVQAEICRWAQEHNEKQYLSIFIALSNQRQNFTFGMNMPDVVYDNEVPVFIRQDRSDNFVTNLRMADEAVRNDSKRNTYAVLKAGRLETKTMGGRYANIYPFGMNETAYSADDEWLVRAKLINMLYETANSSLNTQHSSLIAEDCWHRQSFALKWSNLYSAYSLSVKLDILRALRGLEQCDESRDAMPLTDGEAEILACVEHNRWNVEKLLMGYRKALPEEDKYSTKDESFQEALMANKRRFIHHDIRPFDQLDDVKEIDKEFSRFIPTLITKQGLRFTKHSSQNTEH